MKLICLGTEISTTTTQRARKEKSSEANRGSIHPFGRYGNAVKTRKTISTIAILWPVKAIFEKRAATVEVDTLISPVCWVTVRHYVDTKALFSRLEALYGLISAVGHRLGPN